MSNKQFDTLEARRRIETQLEFINNVYGQYGMSQTLAGPLTTIEDALKVISEAAQETLQKQRVGG